MSDLSAYGVNQFFAGNGLPTTLYAQLHKGVPGTAGTANVCAQSARVSLTLVEFAPGVWDSVASQTWTGPQPATETVTYMTLWDASSAGNCWVIGDVLPIELVSGGGDVTIPAGRITLQMPSSLGL